MNYNNLNLKKVIKFRHSTHFCYHWLKPAPRYGKKLHNETGQAIKLVRNLISTNPVDQCSRRIQIKKFGVTQPGSQEIFDCTGVVVG